MCRGRCAHAPPPVGPHPTSGISPLTRHLSLPLDLGSCSRRRQSTMTTLRLSLSGGSEWRQAREMRRKMMHMDLQQQQQQQPGTPR